MAEVQFKAFMKAGGDAQDSEFPPVCLLYGQSLLVEQACDLILTRVLGDLDRQIYCEVIDGAVEETARALEAVNTYGLLSEVKVVLVKDSRIFYRKHNRQVLARKMVEQYEEGRQLAAARRFADLCSLLELDPGSLPQKQALPPVLGDLPMKMLEELSEVCRSRKLGGFTGHKWEETLEKAISKGFPPKHYLVITTDTVDKRRSLYKTIKARGLVVDCAVADGFRAADQRSQQKVMRDTMEQFLIKAGKKAAAGVFEELWQRCGFELRRFVNDLEKVINYVGPRKMVEPGDVTQVVSRSRQDPIYELTNAMAGRDTGRALFYLHNLLGADTHPLQIMAAMINQVRKLMIARCFLDQLPAGIWGPNMSYQRFQQEVMSAVLEFDKECKERQDGMKDAGDLLLAGNPRSTYPVYQTLVKAGGFETVELVNAFELLNNADLKLKSYSQRPTLVLENVLMNICNKKGRRP